MSPEDQKLPLETKIYTYGKTTELGRVLGLNGTIDILNLLDEEPRRYKDLDPLNETEKDLITAVKKVYPMAISEAEPRVTTK